MFLKDRKKKPSLVLELEEDSEDIYVRVKGEDQGYLLRFDKKSHTIRRVGSVGEDLGFELDDRGRVVIE